MGVVGHCFHTVENTVQNSLHTVVGRCGKIKKTTLTERRQLKVNCDHTMCQKCQ